MVVTRRGRFRVIARDTEFGLWPCCGGPLDGEPSTFDLRLIAPSTENRVRPMSSYLVTGGAGFIGSHIVEELVRRGQAVRVVDNLVTGKRHNLDHVNGVEFVEGDLADPSVAAQAVRDIEYVVHADEGHLEVELRELELPVRALVLVTEAARDLKIPLDPGDHEQLLHLLGRLG